MTSLDQRPPFDAVLTAPDSPPWLPAEDLPAEGWHLYQSGAFLTITYEALIEKEQQRMGKETTDVL